MRRIVAFLLVLSLVGIARLEARWAFQSAPVPLERLLANVDAHLKAHPDDPQAYYSLGRLHSLAWSKGSDEIVVGRGSEGLPEFAPWDSILVPAEKAIREHLEASIRHYRKAVALAPEQALYALGLGWMLEHGAPAAREVGAPPGLEPAPLPPAEAEQAQQWLEALGGEVFAERDQARAELERRALALLPVLLPARSHGNPEVRGQVPDLLAAAWRADALAAYRAAYKLTVSADLKKEHGGPRADSLISLEAGEGIVRVLGARAALDDAERRELAGVQKTVAKLGAGGRAITPLIFPVGDIPCGLADIVDEGAAVSFDLDGRGDAARWTWPRAGAAFLAWDPEATGRIESGLQLFGGVTWWMFWEDGFQPLAMLDDDRDGALSGGELDGIVVWHDRDCDGRSAPGEVTAARAWGIERIAVTPAGRRDGVPWNGAAIRLSDGTERAVWDWVARGR